MVHIPRQLKGNECWLPGSYPPCREIPLLVGPLILADRRMSARVCIHLSPTTMHLPPLIVAFTGHPCDHQVRLNSKCYDERLFLDAGIAHLEAYFVDGGTPPLHVIRRFLTACEANPGAIAVHCKVTYIPYVYTACGSGRLNTAPLKLFTLRSGSTRYSIGVQK